MASPNSSSFTTSDQYPIDFTLSDPYRNRFMLHDDALLPKLRASASSNSYSKAQLGPSAGLWQTNWPANALCSALGPENSIGVQRASSFQSSPHQQLVGSSNASQVLTKDPPAHSPQLIDSPLSLSAIRTLSNMQGKLVDCEMHGGADVTMNGRGSKAASGFCSASNIAEYYQSALHQIEQLASALASPTNSLNEESVVIDQMGSQACSPHSFVANYPFDPGFAKQARRPTSFTSFGSYPPLVNAVAMDDLGSACEAHCVSQSVRETSITKLLARAIATPSRWLPSPILDSDERRAASFAMASANAQNVAHNPKLEALPSDGFPKGAQIDERNECNKLEAPSNAPLYASAMPQTRQRPHEIDQGRVFVAKTELIVHSTENFNSAPKDATSMKKRRLEMEARMGKDGCISNAGEAKISDPVMDSLAKSQISASHGKGKEKSRAKEERGDSNSSMDTSPRDENATKPAEESRQDFVHVRARRGQATDSHSLAERVRREKISNRMKFLQELVPGCSKITGKVTMLDEIINYVQSLQHQVEFLSMKLAARSISRTDQCEVEKPFMGEGKLLRKVCAAHVGAMSERLWHGGDLQPL